MAINSNGVTDTYRWDTVFALRVEDVNRAIKTANTTPPDFVFTSPDGWQIKASFNTWQMTNEGDGKLVSFSLPVATGNLILGGNTHSFNNLSALVELELDYFDSKTRPPAIDGSTYHDLKVKTTLSPGKNKIATVTGITFQSGKPSFLIESLLPVALEGWLNKHLDIFDHVFATVNLGKYIANGQFAWTKPTATDYAFSSKATVEESVLGVLCMTENRPFDGLIPQLSPYAIPQGQRAGYLISNERYLQKILKPAMPFAFEGLKESDMVLSTDQQSLELFNSNGVSIQVTHENKTYDYLIEALIITIEDTYLQIYFRSSTYIGEGVTSHCESTHRYHIKVQNKPNGNPTLVYVEEGGNYPLVNHWTTSDGNIISTIIITLIGVILTAVLSVFTAGAAFIAGALVIGLLTGLAIEAPTIVSVIGKDDAPDLDLLILNFTDPVIWPGQDRFVLGSAALNGCLQLGGTFIPK